MRGIGDGDEGVGAVGALAELVDHGANVGAECAELIAVLVPVAFGNDVAVARARGGEGLEQDALGVREGELLRGERVAAFGGGFF